MQHEINKAASHCGYSMREFDELPGIPAYVDPDIHPESKSDVIARYRTDQLLEAISQDIQAEELARKAKRGRRR